MRKNRTWVFTFGETASRTAEYLEQKLPSGITVIAFRRPPEPLAGKTFVDCVRFVTDEKALFRALFRQLWPRLYWFGPLRTAWVSRVMARLSGKACRVFLVAGLGGRYGSRFVPAAARMLREMGVPPMEAIVQLPFRFEGPARRQRAEKSLAALRSVVGNVQVFDHTERMEGSHHVGIGQYFRSIDEKILSEIINAPAEKRLTE